MGYVLLLVVIICLAALISKDGNAQRNETTQAQVPIMQCQRCGCTNVQIQMMQYAQQGKVKTQRVKRSVAERTANKVGRGTANLLTMGAYGMFVPKKGKYKEITTQQTNIINQKIAICQQCGFSWNVR